MLAFIAIRIAAFLEIVVFMIIPLTAELIFLFSSYSAYLIARFAFFSVSIIFFATAKFCGKVPDGQFQFARAKFCVQVFDEVYRGVQK